MTNNYYEMESRELGARMSFATKLNYARWLKDGSQPVEHRAARQSYNEWQETRERLARLETIKRLAKLNEITNNSSKWEGK